MHVTQQADNIRNNIIKLEEFQRTQNWCDTASVHVHIFKKSHPEIPFLFLQSFTKRL